MEKNKLKQARRTRRRAGIRKRVIGQPARHYIAPFGGTNAGPGDVHGLTDLLRGSGFDCGYLTACGVQPADTAAFFYKRLDAADVGEPLLTGLQLHAPQA